MVEKYSVTAAMVRFGEAILNVEQTCELGTRVIILGVVDVIYRSANRHIDRVTPASARWGQAQPRLTYHGKS